VKSVKFAPHQSLQLIVTEITVGNCVMDWINTTVQRKTTNDNK